MSSEISEPKFVPSEISKCWEKAEELFRARISRISNPPSQEEVTIFLTGDLSLERALPKYRSIKYSVAKKESNRVKVLKALLRLDNSSDPFLLRSSNGIGAVWNIIVLTVGSLCCNEFATHCFLTILNAIQLCRLYEIEYFKDGTAAAEMLELYILESVPELLSMILDLTWHADTISKQSRFQPNLWDIFDSGFVTGYKKVLARYNALKEAVNPIFQERIINSLKGNC
ncbi:hypothetical protein ABW19_dt0208492 [Dactylella cylindrospora]|nr:hypothetical protein ABW19_dt0208492 [Dactylella cylindrospora]